MGAYDRMYVLFIGRTGPVVGAGGGGGVGGHLVPEKKEGGSFNKKLLGPSMV